MRFSQGNELGSHLDSVHGLHEFKLDLSCCGVSFAESKRLEEHVKTEHNAQVLIET